MSTEAQAPGGTRVHGGRIVAARLAAHGVKKLFTLSGGHLFSIYDGCREEGIDIVDVRHEQAAAFAAEGWAKATREPGVCALTAGPGVTNGMSAMASALQSNSPMLVLGGRAPAMRWGQGSLQEIDHVPFVAPLVEARRARRGHGGDPGMVDDALRGRSSRPAARRSSTSRSTTCSWRRRHRTAPVIAARPARRARAEGGVERARASCSAGRRAPGGHGRHRPLLGARRARAASALRRAAGAGRSSNGLARGCVPADHELFFSRARGAALKGADVAIVIGVPMDFRLGFGGVVRRGHEAHRASIGAAPPSNAPARGRRRALRRRGRDARRAARGRRRAAPTAPALDRRSCARRSTRGAPRSRGSWRTTARRCIRCASTASCSR